jgi:ABC-2 type transport system permease protein
MTLWKLEWLRLTRTRRWLSLAGVLIIFGFVSPLTVRYAEDLLESLGPSDIEIALPDPTAFEAMREYVGNVQQLGTLVVVLVSASALALDGRPELAVFLRSRVRSARDLVLPRFGVNAGVAAAAFAAGGFAAWYETEVLLGSLPVGRTLLAILLGSLFQVFVVATVALAAGLAKSFVQTAILAVGLLLSLPLLALIGALGPWLPGELTVLLAELDRPRDAFDYVRPVLVTLVAIPLFLAVAVRRLDAREL